MDSDSSSDSFYDVETIEYNYSIEKKIDNIKDSRKRYSTNPLQILIESKSHKDINNINNVQDETLMDIEIENDIKKSLSSINLDYDEDIRKSYSPEKNDINRNMRKFSSNSQFYDGVKINYSNDDNISMNKSYSNDDNRNVNKSYTNDITDSHSTDVDADANADADLEDNGNEYSASLENNNNIFHSHNTNNGVNMNTIINNYNNENDVESLNMNYRRNSDNAQYSLEKLNSKKLNVNKKGWTFFKKPKSKKKNLNDFQIPKSKSDETVYMNTTDRSVPGQTNESPLYPQNKKLPISKSSNNLELFDNVSHVSTPSLETKSMSNLNFKKKMSGSGSKKKHSKYVNVKTKHKPVKEFNSLRFIQELGKLPTTFVNNNNNNNNNNNTSDSSSQAKDSSTTSKEEMSDIVGPIWALSFSQNGRYLASGGQDMIIRVWVLYSETQRRNSFQSFPFEPNYNNDTLNSFKKKKISPVFRSYPYRYYRGHTSDILDLSWSKSDFLLSSSMDKTVRLWHVMHNECLRTFQHEDFVTSIRFHPKDDRYFLSGSLDSKIRLWSIKDEKVVYWNDISNDQLITSVGFSQDGSFAIAGTYQGDAIFYEFEKLKYNTQIRISNSKGQKKITGIEPFPRVSSGPERILITTNDSRIRLYQLDDKSLYKEYKGLTNRSGQIKASFSDDGRYIICGSEDRQVYIWNVEPTQTPRREVVGKLQSIIRGRDAMTANVYETFIASNCAVTATAFAPRRTRIILETANLRESKIDNFNMQNIMDNNTKSKLANPADIMKNVKNVGKTEKKRNYAAGMIIVSADFNGRIRIYENVINPPKNSDGRKGSDNEEENNSMVMNSPSKHSIIVDNSSYISSANSANFYGNLPRRQKSQDNVFLYNSSSSVCSSQRRPRRSYSQASLNLGNSVPKSSTSYSMLKPSASGNVNMNYYQQQPFHSYNSASSVNMEGQDTNSYSINDQNSSFSVCQCCNCSHSSQYNCNQVKPLNNPNSNSLNNINGGINNNNGNNNNNNNGNINYSNPNNNINMLPPSSLSAMTMDYSYENSQSKNRQVDRSSRSTMDGEVVVESNNNDGDNDSVNNEDELQCSECGKNKFKLFKDGKVKCINCMNEYSMKYSYPKD